MDKVDVLDSGFVRLVDHMGSDLSVVRAARVSYDAAWRAGEDSGSDERLINFLWSNDHTTPFESVEFQLEVKAPIFVIRQWHRHRTWTYNELSARYRELPEDFYVPDPEIVGYQSKDNKQARVITGVSDPAIELGVRRLREHCESSFSLYRDLMSDGWPRELARLALPTSTYSHMFAKVNLLNLLRFLTLRLDSHAQYEIRAYAEAILSLVRPVVPVCIKAWESSI